MMKSATALISSETSTTAEFKPTRRKDVEAHLIRSAAIENARALNDRSVPTTPVKLEGEESIPTTAVGDSDIARRKHGVASFTALQEWDGHVVDVRPDSFVARITDITSSGAPDAEEVEIPFSELSGSDIPRVKEGTLFRWSIGYQRSMDGQKMRVSQIVLRQLPRWRAEKIAKAQKDAQEIFNSINWR